MKLKKFLNASPSLLPVTGCIILLVLFIRSFEDEKRFYYSEISGIIREVKNLSRGDLSFKIRQSNTSFKYTFMGYEPYLNLIKAGDSVHKPSMTKDINNIHLYRFYSSGLYKEYYLKP